MNKIPFLIGCMSLFLGSMFLLPAPPGPSAADIFRWQDDSGTIHFTDNPSTIPERYRSRGKIVENGPPESGRPGVSSVGSPSPASPAALPSQFTPAPEPAQVRQEDSSSEADQLRARIAAKERFIEGIDRKRSHTLNPLGNRFVSQEDQDLYKKYSEELPQDRQRLKELQEGRP